MSKKAKQRDLGKEQLWRQAIRKRERSGLTIRAFCQREGLTESSYQFWRRELVKRDGVGRSSSRRRKAEKDRVKIQSLPTFASVTVGGASPDMARWSEDGSMPIEIMLRGNVRVRVGRGVDLQLLDQVLSVVERRGC
jgi:hypothetical protein